MRRMIWDHPPRFQCQRNFRLTPWACRLENPPSLTPLEPIAPGEESLNAPFISNVFAQAGRVRGFFPTDKRLRRERTAGSLVLQLHYLFGERVYRLLAAGPQPGPKSHPDMMMACADRFAGCRPNPIGPVKMSKHFLFCPPFFR